MRAFFMLDTLKALLRSPERKQSRTSRLIAIESGGRARWTSRDYAALTREDYMKNAIVHRAVRLTARASAAFRSCCRRARPSTRPITQLSGEISRYNRLFGQVWDIVDHLKLRDGDQRKALTALFTHPNPQVRLTAARATLAIAPVAARHVIQTIADSKVHPWAMDAGMCLTMLDEGIFKPT